jgi:hypothetical protein
MSSPTFTFTNQNGSKNIELSEAIRGLQNLHGFGQQTVNTLLVALKNTVDIAEIQAVFDTYAILCERSASLPHGTMKTTISRT